MTIRKWLTISAGGDCRSSRNPPPPGGAGLVGGGALGIIDHEVERDQPVMKRWKRWKTPALSGVWIGGLEESLPGCTRMPR